MLFDYKKITKIIKHKYHSRQPYYLNFFDWNLIPIKSLSEKKISEIAKITRALIFALLDYRQSGHPGGSSSKVEQILTLLLAGDLIKFNAQQQDNNQDRFVWSAGHCSPLLYSVLSLIYESFLKTKTKFNKEISVVFDDLFSFRHIHGLSGHIENNLPLTDYATGPSGHGLSAALGMAILHKSNLLPTKVWVFMGDAESEEGLTFEARNLASSLKLDNLIVSLDYNHYGIDGNINQVVGYDYYQQWLGLGWNVIEVNGHNIRQLYYAYKVAKDNNFNQRPTVIIAQTIKGKDYGELSNSNLSHGQATKHDDFIKLMSKLGFNLKKNDSLGEVIDLIAKRKLNQKISQFITKKVLQNQKNTSNLSFKDWSIKNKLKTKSLTKIKRPKKLPDYLQFQEGKLVSTREAASLWFKWLMTQTKFFYIGAGDLAKSVLTNKAEEVYGLFSNKNKLGRGIRYGIAEQNMVMSGLGLASDRLFNEGLQSLSVFATYAVFSGLTVNDVRLGLINNFLNPHKRAYFIYLLSHDGPETGEDGPTHQGLFWLSAYESLPGIKIFKPFDANETIELLFKSLETKEPIILSVSRPKTIVWSYSKLRYPQSITNGAYIFADYQKNNFNPKIVLVVSGPKILMNINNLLPKLRKSFNIKVVAVNSVSLFKDFEIKFRKKAEKIISQTEREQTISLNNGWENYLDYFLNGKNISRRHIGVKNFLGSGTADEVYKQAGLDEKSLLKKIKLASKYI